MESINDVTRIVFIKIGLSKTGEIREKEGLLA